MVMPYLPEYEGHEPQSKLTPAVAPFAGRLGGNQDFVVDRSDPRNDKVLEKVPDAAPWMSLSEILDLRGFLSLDLWKFAFLECIAWVTLHAPAAVEAPKTEVGIYHTLTFFSPLFGGITNLLLTPLLIYTFAPSSGGHISPTITLATLFARIISFPRAILYMAGQTLGGALAGFAIHTAYGSRDFTVGGCHVDTSLVPVNAALIIEFFACLVLIFLAFGVALDPRQAKIFGHAAGPWLVGVVLGVVCWATAFTRPGYIGAMTTGIGRLLRHKPEETSDTTNSVASINESISSPDTTFNPAFQNDVKLTQWNGWDGAWHFISKYSHHLSRSILQYAYSYYDHAGCMNNYPELFKRHKQLMKLEAIDEFSQDAQAQSRGASRVRFVNYFTKSTGTIRAGGADNSSSTHIVIHEDLRKCDWQGNLEDATNILEMDHKHGHARRKSSPHGLVDSAGLLWRKQDICPKSSGGQHSSLHLESSVRTVVQSAVTDGQDENPEMGCERSNQSQAARRQFCYLPKNISNGKEHLWIPVQMEGIDEITAHQSMFLPQGTYYDKLVGDTVALIEGWISDDLTRRTILEGGFCK
ncbi:hypothetical protein APSETT444_008081 [Aspergillus pseudonomiae]